MSTLVYLMTDADFAKIPALAKHDVPLLHICGSEDFLLQRHTRVVEDTYHQLGGLITRSIECASAGWSNKDVPAVRLDEVEQHLTNG